MDHDSQTKPAEKLAQYLECVVFRPVNRANDRAEATKLIQYALDAEWNSALETASIACDKNGWEVPEREAKASHVIRGLKRGAAS